MLTKEVPQQLISPANVGAINRYWQKSGDDPDLDEQDTVTDDFLLRAAFTRDYPYRDPANQDPRVTVDWPVEDMCTWRDMMQYLVMTENNARRELIELSSTISCADGLIICRERFLETGSESYCSSHFYKYPKDGETKYDNYERHDDQGSSVLDWRNIRYMECIRNYIIHMERNGLSPQDDCSRIYTYMFDDNDNGGCADTLKHTNGSAIQKYTTTDICAVRFNFDWGVPDTSFEEYIDFSNFITCISVKFFQKCFDQPADENNSGEISKCLANFRFNTFDIGTVKSLCSVKDGLCDYADDSEPNFLVHVEEICNRDYTGELGPGVADWPSWCTDDCANPVPIETDVEGLIEFMPILIGTMLFFHVFATHWWTFRHEEFTETLTNCTARWLLVFFCCRRGAFWKEVDSERQPFEKAHRPCCTAFQELLGQSLLYIGLAVASVMSGCCLAGHLIFVRHRDVYARWLLFAEQGFRSWWGLRMVYRARINQDKYGTDYVNKPEMWNTYRFLPYFFPAIVAGASLVGIFIYEPRIMKPDSVRDKGKDCRKRRRQVFMKRNGLGGEEKVRQMAFDPHTCFARRALYVEYRTQWLRNVMIDPDEPKKTSFKVKEGTKIFFAPNPQTSRDDEVVRKQLRVDVLDEWYPGLLKGVEKDLVSGTWDVICEVQFPEGMVRERKCDPMFICYKDYSHSRTIQENDYWAKFLTVGVEFQIALERRIPKYYFLEDIEDIKATDEQIIDPEDLEYAPFTPLPNEWGPGEEDSSSGYGEIKEENFQDADPLIILGRDTHLAANLKHIKETVAKSIERFWVHDLDECGGEYSIMKESIEQTVLVKTDGNNNDTFQDFFKFNFKRDEDEGVWKTCGVSKDGHPDGVENDWIIDKMNLVDFDPYTFDSNDYKRTQEISFTLHPEDEPEQHIWGLEIDDRFRISKIHHDSQMDHMNAKIGWKLISIDNIRTKRKNKWKIEMLLTDRNESHELRFLAPRGKFADFENEVSFTFRVLNVAVTLGGRPVYYNRRATMRYHDRGRWIFDAGGDKVQGVCIARLDHIQYYQGKDVSKSLTTFIYQITFATLRVYPHGGIDIKAWDLKEDPEARPGEFRVSIACNKPRQLEDLRHIFGEHCDKFRIHMNKLLERSDLEIELTEVNVQPVRMLGTMFLDSDAQDPVKANEEVRLLHPENDVLPPKKTRWFNCCNYDFHQETISIGDAYNLTPYDGVYIQKNPDEFDLFFEHEDRKNGKPYELKYDRGRRRWVFSDQGTLGNMFTTKQVFKPKWKPKSGMQWSFEIEARFPEIFRKVQLEWKPHYMPGQNYFHLRGTPFAGKYFEEKKKEGKRHSYISEMEDMICNYRNGRWWFRKNRNVTSVDMRAIRLKMKCDYMRPPSGEDWKEVQEDKKTVIFYEVDVWRGVRRYTQGWVGLNGMQKWNLTFAKLKMTKKREDWKASMRADVEEDEIVDVVVHDKNPSPEQQRKDIGTGVVIESGVKHQLGYAFVRMDSGDVAEEGTLALHNYAGTPFDFEYRDELPKETTRLRTTLEFFHRPVTEHEDYEVEDEKIDDAVEEKPPREVHMDIHFLEGKWYSRSEMGHCEVRNGAVRFKTYTGRIKFKPRKKHKKKKKKKKEEEKTDEMEDGWPHGIFQLTVGKEKWSAEDVIQGNCYEVVWQKHGKGNAEMTWFRDLSKAHDVFNGVNCIDIWQSRRHEKATVEIIRTIPAGNLNLSRQQKNNKPKQVRTGVFVSIMVKRRMRINELNSLKCNLFGYSGRGVQIRAGRLDMGLEGMKQKYWKQISREISKKGVVKCAHYVLERGEYTIFIDGKLKVHNYDRETNIRQASQHIEIGAAKYAQNGADPFGGMYGPDSIQLPMGIKYSLLAKNYSVITRRPWKHYYKIKGGDSKTYARTRVERKRYKPTGVIKKSGLEERQMRMLLPYEICIDDDVTDALRMKWLTWRQKQDNFGQQLFKILIDMLWGVEALEILARIAPILEISAWEDKLGRVNSIAFRYWDKLFMEYKSPYAEENYRKNAIRLFQHEYITGLEVFYEEEIINGIKVEINNESSLSQTLVELGSKGEGYASKRLHVAHEEHITGVEFIRKDELSSPGEEKVCPLRITSAANLDDDAALHTEDKKKKILLDFTTIYTCSKHHPMKFKTFEKEGMQAICEKCRKKLHSKALMCLVCDAYCHKRCAHSQVYYIGDYAEIELLHDNSDDPLLRLKSNPFVYQDDELSEGGDFITTAGAEFTEEDDFNAMLTKDDANQAGDLRAFARTFNKDVTTPFAPSGDYTPFSPGAPPALDPNFTPTITSFEDALTRFNTQHTTPAKRISRELNLVPRQLSFDFNNAFETGEGNEGLPDTLRSSGESMTGTDAFVEKSVRDPNVKETSFMNNFNREIRDAFGHSIENKAIGCGRSQEATVVATSPEIAIRSLGSAFGLGKIFTIRPKEMDHALYDTRKSMFITPHDSVFKRESVLFAQDAEGHFEHYVTSPGFASTDFPESPKFAATASNFPALRNDYQSVATPGVDEVLPGFKESPEEKRIPYLTESPPPSDSEEETMSIDEALHTGALLTIRGESLSDSEIGVRDDSSEEEDSSQEVQFATVANVKRSREEAFGVSVIAPTDREDSVSSDRRQSIVFGGDRERNSSGSGTGTGGTREDSSTYEMISDDTPDSESEERLPPPQRSLGDRMDSEGYQPFSYASEPSIKKHKPNAVANVFNNALRDDGRPSNGGAEINIDISDSESFESEISVSMSNQTNTSNYSLADSVTNLMRKFTPFGRAKVHFEDELPKTDSKRESSQPFVVKNSAALYDIAESDDENVHSESESEENFIKRQTVRVFHPENDEIIPVHPIEDRPEAIAPPWFDRVDVDNLDIEELQSWCADNHENLYSLVRMKMKLRKRQRLRGKHKLRVLKKTLMLYRRFQPKVTVYDVEAFAERWEIEAKTLKTLKPDDLLTEEYFQEMLLLLTYS